MKYVLLIYVEESRLDTMPQVDADAMEQECAAYRHTLQESGHLRELRALHASATATTVRVRDGRIVLSDGPGAAAHEQLVGMYLVEARDLNEAIRLAVRLPLARLGSVEVRPVRELLAAMQAGRAAG